MALKYLAIQTKSDVSTFALSYKISLSASDEYQCLLIYNVIYLLLNCGL